ncbi:hotdog fold thioesterase [Wenzhouxiangella sp. XN79A]|uniref:PaaI family thioesterase n=1 Tax=Wenzhouxiangella sp. XN79A TaxID=2724193 RepID=UPI00144AE1A5|nr:hotdog fold thioesterase [Wenzhouxiangella sp. XN79A]NKI34691.1 hotdog fold thioesterase [Wenzhouxiangella sp. XN79A]
MPENDWIERLNAHRDGTLMDTLDIRYRDAGPDFLVADMPVDERHRQPMGILHGGASAALAESVGSAASAMVLADTGRAAVGLELAINHLAAVRNGRITARAEAVHLGRSTHLWQIRIEDEHGRKVALAKLTLLVGHATN